MVEKLPKKKTEQEFLQFANTVWKNLSENELVNFEQIFPIWRPIDLSTRDLARLKIVEILHEEVFNNEELDYIISSLVKIRIQLASKIFGDTLQNNSEVLQTLDKPSKRLGYKITTGTIIGLVVALGITAIGAAKLVQDKFSGEKPIQPRTRTTQIANVEASTEEPTFTLSPTFTPTTRITETPEPSATATLTVEDPTLEPSSTSTLSPTATLTPTPESSATPTSTITPSLTPTVTDTNTATDTPTDTITPSPTPTSQPTETFTAEPSATNTNTLTPEATPTHTNTPTATYTQSQTATNRPTETVIPTSTPTLTTQPTLVSMQTNTPMTRVSELFVTSQNSNMYSEQVTWALESTTNEFKIIKYDTTDISGIANCSGIVGVYMHNLGFNVADLETTESGDYLSQNSFPIVNTRRQVDWFNKINDESTIKFATRVNASLFYENTKDYTQNLAPGSLIYLYKAESPNGYNAPHHVAIYRGVDDSGNPIFSDFAQGMTGIHSNRSIENIFEYVYNRKANGKFDLSGYDTGNAHSELEVLTINIDRIPKELTRTDIVPRETINPSTFLINDLLTQQSDKRIRLLNASTNSGLYLTVGNSLTARNLLRSISLSSSRITHPLGDPQKSPSNLFGGENKNDYGGWFEGKHTGVDYTLNTRSGKFPVFNVFDGVIVAIGNGFSNEAHQGLGPNTVIVRTSQPVGKDLEGNDMYLLSVFGHLSTVQHGFYIGEFIPSGETIGMSGNLGNANEVHLHYEMVLAKASVIPIDFIEGDLITWADKVNYFNPLLILDYLKIETILPESIITETTTPSEPTNMINFHTRSLNLDTIPDYNFLQNPNYDYQIIEQHESEPSKINEIIIYGGLNSWGGLAYDNQGEMARDPVEAAQNFFTKCDSAIQIIGNLNAICTADVILNSGEQNSQENLSYNSSTVLLIREIIRQNQIRVSPLDVRISLHFRIPQEWKARRVILEIQRLYAGLVPGISADDLYNFGATLSLDLELPTIANPPNVYSTKDLNDINKAYISAVVSLYNSKINNGNWPSLRSHVSFGLPRLTVYDMGIRSMFTQSSGILPDINILPASMSIGTLDNKLLSFENINKQWGRTSAFMLFIREGEFSPQLGSQQQDSINQTISQVIQRVRDDYGGNTIIFQ